ncbi:MAG: oligosaccharide repeat unit polymerase [Acidobacteria bacterium]|nr:oligosaccharide repeat unit polymerase [Acidobacteriota bacterium]
MSSSVVLFVVLIGLALLAVPVARRLTGDYFPPAALIVSTWCATLGLFFLYILPYPSIRPGTAAFIGAAVVLMAAGAWVAQRWAGAGRPSRPLSEGFANAAIVAIAIGGLLGTAWYVWAVVDALGWRAFDRPGDLRIALGEYVVPSRYLFLQFLCVVAPIVAMALHFTGTRLRPGVWAVVALAALSTWITTDRTQFFIVVLTTYFMYVLTASRRLTFVRLAGITAATGVGLAAYFLAVGLWLGKTPSNLGAEVQFPGRPGAEARAGGAPDGLTAAPGQGPGEGGAVEAPEARSEPPAWLLNNLRRVSTLYLYSTGSYSALDRLLYADGRRTGGVHVVYPVARLLKRAGLIDRPLPSDIAPFIHLGLTRGRDIEFNGYTFLYYPISDFGPAGGLVYAAGVGLLAGFIYGRYRQTRLSPFWLVTMGHLSTALVLTVFVNKFSNTAAWYMYLWSCAPFLVARAASAFGVHAVATRSSR